MDTNKVSLDVTQYICVKLGSEQYGIDIQYVDNIGRMQKITRVPKAQSYFLGVINVRGEVIPVMSMRRRLNLENDNFTSKSRIIILKFEQDLVGVVVDEVKEVVNLREADIEKVSHNSKDVKSSFINGVGKYDDQLISLFDIFAIIAEKESDE